MESRIHRKVYVRFGRGVTHCPGITWEVRSLPYTPLPEGITTSDLGKCNHAIRVPGAQYEIGVVRRDQKYILLWDFWHQGGLEQKLGKNAGRLKQAYTIERVRKEARLKGHRICEQKTNQGIRLVLRV